MNLFYLIGAAFIGLGVISDKKDAEKKKVDTTARIVPELKPETEEKPISTNQNPDISESNQIDEAIANEQESDNNGGGD
jgi:hypothetical protein